MILEFLAWASLFCGALIIVGWIADGPVGAWLIERNRRSHR